MKRSLKIFSIFTQKYLFSVTTSERKIFSFDCCVCCFQLIVKPFLLLRLQYTHHMWNLFLLLSWKSSWFSVDHPFDQKQEIIYESEKYFFKVASLFLKQQADTYRSFADICYQSCLICANIRSPCHSVWSWSKQQHPSYAYAATYTKFEKMNK